MSGLPPDMMINDILPRVPVESLDRFRYVSKEWNKFMDDPEFAIIQMNRSLEEPIPVIMSTENPYPGPSLVNLFRITESESKQAEAKKDSVLELKYENQFYYTIRGSCNGLLYLSRYSSFCKTILSVIHPIRKQRYELPPVKAMQSCGLGFDASTNTFKMCVSAFEANSNTLHILVHVLGTDDSWREMPQIPCYKMFGESVFAHGCLHWLGYHKENPFIVLRSDMPLPPNHRKKVVCFDVSTEEFGLIDPPPERTLGDDWIEMKLVDLHGEVGLSYTNRRSLVMELWALKQPNKQWVIYCRIDANPSILRELTDIVGLWNNSGDILVEDHTRKRFFVYSLKTRGFRQLKLVGWESGCDTSIHMYQSSIFSIPAMTSKPSWNNPPTVSVSVSPKETSKKTRNRFHMPISSPFSFHGIRKKPSSRRRIAIHHN